MSFPAQILMRQQIPVPPAVKQIRKIRKVVPKSRIEISEILRAFFGISPQRIERDFDALESKVSQFRSLEREFEPGPCPTARDLAETIHRHFLLGKKVTIRSQLPPDLILFSATVSAHRIAELSCSVATGKGRLSELAGLFEILEKSGELDGKAPDVLLSNELLEQIHDSVFLEILRRYDLNEYGRIFEEDRSLYEMRFEAGRRLVDGGLDRSQSGAGGGSARL